MSLAQNMGSYLANFDGKAKDFSEVEVLFDAIFDEEFCQLDGDTLNKEQLKRIYASLFALGSTATDVEFKYLSSDRFEYKYHLANKITDVDLHFICKVVDGKIVSAKAADNTVVPLLEARRDLTFYDVEKRFRTHWDVYDGTVKSFDEMRAALDDVIHEDFVNTLSGRPIDKEGIMKQSKFFLSIGTKAELLYFKPLDDTHFEDTVRIQNKLVDIELNSRVTIKDGKVVKVEPREGTRPVLNELQNAFGVASLMQKMRAHELVQNSDGSTVEDIENTFESIFHDDVEAEIEGFVMGKPEMRSEILQDFADKAKIRFAKMEVIDGSHVEIVVTKDDGWRRHQILEVKDGKIVKIVTVEDDTGAKTEVQRNRRTAPPAQLVASI